ncbi:MAG: hypothetical protein ED859_17705 [Desulfuromonadales bacterium]|nr:MAG: hypothetical protein ED859_17705 [Desulfuromonadales bacterium]
MSLGSLLYSVPLAPCEEIKVAAVDWRRKDWAKRESAVDESHFQDTTISRDETVSEVVRMSSDKSATATTVGGGASLSIPDLNLALGGTVAQETLSEVTSSQAIASRGVNDRVRQASNTVRNTRAFSVAEVSQEEESVVRTKIIRNHNHCHTVTFQYFEVLQNYLLSTRVIRTRPVLFIPFEPLSFNVDTIAAHGYLIRRGLLDPSLASMFDEYLGLVKPAGESDAKDLGDTTTNVYGFEVSWRRDKNSTNHPEYIKLAVDGETLNFVSSTNNGSLGAETTVSFKPTVPLTLEKIDRIGCIYDLPGGITGDNKKFYSLEVRANLAMAGTPVYVTLAYWPKADFSTDDWVFQRIASERPIQIVTAIPLTPPKGFERLLAHLNANKFYYSCLIIAGGDAAFRYLMLQGYPSAKKPLVDMVLPEVVGYMGDMLAFPIRDLSLIPDNLIGGNPDIDREERLKEILAPKSDPDERVISLPTPGIFAESQLGLCSACEKIDDTRFWDWQKSPCPDSAPDINSQMLASRYQDTSPLVQFVQPSLKPEPVQIPELPKPMIEIGDNTLANLTKGLDLKNLKDVLDLVGGLVKAASDGFKSNADAVKDTPPSGGPGSGDTSSTDSADTGAADTGGLDASTAAAATPI